MDFRERSSNPGCLALSSNDDVGQRDTRAHPWKPSTRVLVQWIHLMEALGHTFRSTFSKGRTAVVLWPSHNAQLCAHTFGTKNSSMPTLFTNVRTEFPFVLTVSHSVYSRVEIVSLLVMTRVGRWMDRDVKGKKKKKKKLKIAYRKFTCETFSFATRLCQTIT